MAQFNYKARRRTGELVQGVLDVADRSAAVLQIERLGLLPVAIDAPRGAEQKPERAKAAAPTGCNDRPGNARST